MLPGQSTGIGAPAGTVSKQPSATQLWQRRARRLATRRSHNSTSGRRLARPATQGELTGMIRHRLALVAGVASALAMLPAAASAAVHGSYTTIDVPGAADTFGLGINDRGVVVGTYTAKDGVNHGFLDHRGRFTKFNVPDAGTGSGQGTVGATINNHGVIAGTYIDAHGVPHGYIDRHGV